MGEDPAGIRPAPIAAASRRRVKARVLTGILIAVVVLLASGGVAVARWAPWRLVPPQRPGGLTVSSATFNSITVGWSEAKTGPVPASYQILENGRPVNSAGPAVRSYLAAGLTPGSDYLFQVVAILGKLRSPESAPLHASTRALPPLGDAVLSGPFTVGYTHVTKTDMTTTRILPDNWTMTPQCSSGSCSVRLTGAFETRPFKTIILRRTGLWYSGETSTTKFFHCNGLPQLADLTIRLKVTGGSPVGAQWLVSGWSGSFRLSVPTGLCAGSELTARIASI